MSRAVSALPGWWQRPSSVTPAKKSRGWSSSPAAPAPSESVPLDTDTADTADHSTQETGEQPEYVVEQPHKADDVIEKGDRLTHEPAERTGRITGNIQRNRAQGDHEAQKIDVLGAKVQMQDAAGRLRAYES